MYALTLLATLLLAGIYPAITLSSFKVQFSFSILLITSTIIIGKQLKYIREKNLGYDKQNVFNFQLHNMSSHYDAVAAELLKQPGITGVTGSGADIINNSSGSSDVNWDGKRADQQSFTIIQMPVERNFMQVMNIQLVEGNGFTGSPAEFPEHTTFVDAIQQKLAGKNVCKNHGQGCRTGNSCRRKRMEKI